MEINEVVRATYWSNVHIGGQVTEIQWGNVRAYVRENIRYNSFQLHAGERLGFKRGQMPPDAVQVLELCTPRQYWDAIAQKVAELDEMNREVVRGRFSKEWAIAQFAGSRINCR